MLALHPAPETDSHRSDELQQSVIDDATEGSLVEAREVEEGLGEDLAHAQGLDETDLRRRRQKRLQRSRMDRILLPCGLFVFLCCVGILLGTLLGRPSNNVPETDAPSFHQRQHRSMRLRPLMDRWNCSGRHCPTTRLRASRMLQRHSGWHGTGWKLIRK